MRDFTETNLTEEVISRMSGKTDPRLKQIMTSLIRHMHDFVREVELTEEEWFAGIQFLTAVGQKCDDKRQEFILLSDTLGVSMLVDAISHRKARGATESTVFGPFYREGAREIEQGGDIAGATPGGVPCVMSGRVLDQNGKPIAGALLDIWQAAPNGLYESQDASQPDMNLRGRLKTDRQGRYWFRTVSPVSYPIPDDGPVGQMLRATGRHPWRPAHVHFIVSAPGYQPVTTHVFASGNEYLDSDAVFGVKNSLIADFKRSDSAAEAKKYGVKAPFDFATYDFGLKPKV